MWAKASLTGMTVLVLALAFPAAAGAAPAASQDRLGPVLLGLAVLLMAAKLGGLLADRLGQPSVLGELIIGVGLGNVLPLLLGGGAGIDFVRSNATLHTLAEVGVLALLFDVGLESDLRAFRRVGPSAGLVAVIGVVAPLGLGWTAAAWLLPGTSTLTHVFVGATLTATSVGITIRVLRDMGATRSPEGEIIIGAAIADDVLGLIVLAVVSGMAVTGAVPSIPSVLAILAKAVLFLVLAVSAGHYLSDPLVRLVSKAEQPRLMLVVGLALCFTLAFLAELIGLAGIIGAFAAGLALDPYGKGVRTHEAEASLSELLSLFSDLFVPLFFVLMGMQVHLASLGALSLLGFSGVLIVCAVAGKLVSAFGVVRPRVNAFAVAIGMVPRGEVGLIFAGVGAGLSVAGQPVLSQGVYSALVLMVLVTTVVAPIGLRRVLSEAS